MEMLLSNNHYSIARCEAVRSAILATAWLLVWVVTVQWTCG